MNKKRSKKIRNLIFVCALAFILCGTATYAWFIGMKTVNVNAFDIEIATTEGLFLSMDGVNWSYSLDAKNATAYADNTNTWAEDGLIPVSTVGDMDGEHSTMKLYEKGSLTTTKGGYRLLATRVHNYDGAESTKPDTNGLSARNFDNEAKGYVAFDLFIKNVSGTEYYEQLDPLNEEAIYLTTNSKVVVSSNGGEAGTGIENSVRLAFAQIGRVKAVDSEVEDILNIKCNNTANYTGTEGTTVTGICRDAQIWEPNDKDHVQNALNWYNTSCRQRTGEDVTDPDSYDWTGSPVYCNSVALSETVPTYAISRRINVSDNVDVYDGARYNNYEDNTITYSDYKDMFESEDASAKLVEYDTFTDTEKLLEGTDRPTFMTLAPNSITKLRVYVYIEGQDIDNYDFASLGKKITVNFGFTKERYIEEDIDYEGPALPPTNPSTAGM